MPAAKSGSIVMLKFWSWARAVIGEVERVLDQCIDVSRLPVVAAAARMRQHALDDAIGPAPVLGDLGKIAGQHLDDCVNLGAGVLAERGHGRLGRLLQLIEQFDREVREVVDEIERVLDLVGDPGGQLAQGRHLLRMQQARLRRLQVVQCLLGSVAGGTDFGLGAFPLGDVAVDDDDPAARHRVGRHLDDPAVGTRALSICRSVNGSTRFRPRLIAPSTAPSRSSGTPRPVRNLDATTPCRA
jgi:hypothetical protein